MLPAMPRVKTTVFTRRLVAFHQTFAPLDKRTKSNPAIVVIGMKLLLVGMLKM